MRATQSREDVAKHPGQPKHGGCPPSGNRVGRFTGTATALASHVRKGMSSSRKRRSCEHETTTKNAKRYLVERVGRMRSSDSGTQEDKATETE